MDTSVIINKYEMLIVFSKASLRGYLFSRDGWDATSETLHN